MIYKDVPDSAIAVLDPGFKILRIHDERFLATGESRDDLMDTECVEVVASDTENVRKVA